MIYCNGIPKSGTHALVRAVTLLGFRSTEVIQGHYDIKHRDLPKAMQARGFIHIKRNPRNIMISWLRYRNFPLTKEELIKTFNRYHYHPIYTLFARYERFLSDGTLVVRFEDLFSDGGDSLQRIADKLDVSVPKNAYDEIEGKTITFKEVHSNWQDYPDLWDDSIEEEWIKARGPEIEKIWGYTYKGTH